MARFLPEEPKVTWREVLKRLVKMGGATPKELADALDLGHEIDTYETRNGERIPRRRHTGQMEANTRLRRLADWGMAKIVPVPKEDGRGSRFIPTDYGRKVAKARS